MTRVGRGTRIAVVVAIAMVALGSCQVATIGAKCTGGVGRDSVNVLVCKDGRWSKLMTIADYVELLKQRNGSAATTTLPAVVAPPEQPPVNPGGGPDDTTTTVAPTTTTSTTTSTTTTTRPTNRTGIFPNAPLQGWRVNGQSFANLVVGSTVYVGGEFTTATSYNGSQSVGRANVAAFDLDTGELRSGFVADTDGLVRDFAVNGSTLYIAGAFSTVNGVSRTNLAAVDLTTGAVTSWNPRPNQTVFKIAIGGGKLFLAGNFNYIGGTFRNHAGAVSLSSGAVDGAFDPDFNTGTTAIAVNSTGTRIYVGGPYDSINGNLPANIDFVPGNLSPDFDGSMDALDANGDQLGIVYQYWRGTPYDMKLEGNDLFISTGANRAGRWNATTGARGPVLYCNGDGQAVAHLGNYLYGGFHESCNDADGTENFATRLVRYRLSGGSGRDYSFTPTFDQFWGVRDINGDANVMVISGQFNWISDVHVGGFAIFKAVG